MLCPRRDKLEAVINYFDKYTTQIFVVQIGVFFILLTIILWVYYYNRKKYHNLKHQIPASVVKNYLDSIIQNSTALKSSLFRGGGLDVDPSSVPSVMPLDQLQNTTPIGVSSGGGNDDALRAEVAKLQSQLAEKQNIINDLESKNTDLSGEVKAKQERIEELEALLAEAQANVGDGSGAGDDSELQAQLKAITEERDSIKEDLAQYDIIEDDLADLKRLKQENEQLKASLDGDAGAVAQPAPAAVAEPAPVVASESEPESELEPESVAAAPVEPAPVVIEEPVAEAAPEVAAEAAPADEESSDEKSPEDLLSEFEKMLG